MTDNKDSITISDIKIAWDTEKGTCYFEKLPVAMMWVDTTLAGLMAGVQAMVGTERFALALQSEGRKSVEADWQIISKFSTFEEGFQAITNIAAVAGWGQWEIISIDLAKEQCIFRTKNSWEGKYQKTLGVCWSSGMLAGKMAGYCSKLFNKNCWAEQTTFTAKDDEYDTFYVKASKKTIESEVNDLLLSDSATKADMAVALKKLQSEIKARTRAERERLKIQEQLEVRVEQRTAELKESETRFRSIIESSPMGVHIWELSPDEKLIFSGYNPAADTILNTDNSQFLGREILEAFPTLSETVVPQKYKKICETGIPWQTKQVNYNDSNIKGAFEVYAFQTSPRKMASFFLDITEKLKNEENYRRLDRQVQQAEHLESLGVLAGGIAHDFNNILMAILGNLSLVNLALPKESNEHSLVKEAEKASLRAKDLTQQLLTFSKGDEPIKETSSMAEVIVDSSNFNLRGSNVACEFNIPKDLWLVSIDRGQMSQVIQNIIVNAKNSMPTGGIITVTGQNINDIQKENVPLPQNKKYIKITISDQGIGIPANIIDKIFEPYFSTKQEGSGLGLAITYSIITKHEGYISVQSETGSGSSFFIYIPTTDQGLIHPVETQATTNFKKLNILVMDDEETVRDVTKAMLENLGHEVLLAAHGQEAIDIYTTAAHPIDLVIMDLTIPGGMGGKEAVQKILKFDKKAKVIVSSGYSVDPIMANYKRYGFCSAIAKPYQFHELSKAIYQVSD